MSLDANKTMWQRKGIDEETLRSLTMLYNQNKKPKYAWQSDISWQVGLLLGLGVRDFVDQQADTALGDDVGDAVAQLNGDNCCCRFDSEHGEQVHHRISAPTDHRHDLCGFNVASDHRVRLACRSR